MKKLLLPLLILVSSSLVFAQGNIPVTFQVDLTIKTAEGLFIPGTDNVTVRGSFMDETGLRDGDWFPSEGPFVLSDDDADTIYTLILDMPDSLEGNLYEFKYQINDAIWEGDPNRKFTLVSPETIIPVDYFDRDSVVTVQVVNTLNFTADLTDIYGSGVGYFDPDLHVLNLMGLDWVGAIVLEGSERMFVEDPFSPGIFHTTMIIQGVEGDSTKWKCKAEPESDFFNWGWEITPDRWHIIQEDGAVVDVPIFKPAIFPMQPPLTEDVHALFQVNMTHAVNYYTGESIDPASLIFVGVKGQNEILGAWAGDWLPSDTTNGTLLVLNDDGVKGDRVANDKIWSLLVTFPAGNAGGPSLYKYGAYYPGADTINGGYHPLDNEMQGTDHWLNVIVGDTTVLYDDFGYLESFTGVEAKDQILIPEKMELSQNYPNPFNPVTTIQYSVPKNSVVNLTIYNVMGQKVSTLINGKQDAGVHTVVFNASNIPSGVYFYKLTSGDYSVVRKMILMK